MKITCPIVPWRFALLVTLQLLVATWLLGVPDGALAYPQEPGAAPADQDTEADTETPQEPTGEPPTAPADTTSSTSEDAPQPAKTSSGVELLDQATEAKLFASKMSDLDRVVSLCDEALAAGLDEDSANYARELLSSSLYERANRILAPILEGDLDRSWKRRRSLAQESLTKAIEARPDHADALLLLAKLSELPEGDRVQGIAWATRAVDLFADFPARQSEALVVRAALREPLEEQLADLDLAVTADETNVDAWRRRGELRLKNGDDQGAIDDLMHVLANDDEDLETRDVVISLLAENEKYDEALELANSAIESKPDEPRGYLLRSGIYVARGEKDRGLEDLNQAMKLDGSDVATILMRAQLLANREQFDESLADIDRALELKPGLPTALLLRSTIHQLQGDFKAARVDLERILRRDPDNIGLRMQIAALYLADGRPRRAIELYSRIIEQDDTLWQALQARGDARLAIGAHAEAIADYERALQQAPEESGILNNLAWVLATSPKDEVRSGTRAIELAEKACQLTEYKAAHILSTLAAGYAEAGDFAKAREWSQKAVESGADDDIKAQLAEELKSYEAEKPWRELQETAEPDDDGPSVDDLDLEGPAVPSDP